MADDSSATDFAGLDNTFPVGSVDTMDKVDNQLRMLKTVLLTMFSQLASTAVTANASELNTLDGFTGVTGDLNIIAGAAAAGVSAAEFQFLNGVTSAIQTQLGNKAAKGANSDITSLTGLTTALSAAQGGLGVGSPTDHYVLVGSGASPVTPVSPGTAGKVLTSNGTGTDPSFQDPAVGAGDFANGTQAFSVSAGVATFTIATGLGVSDFEYTLKCQDTNGCIAICRDSAGYIKQFNFNVSPAASLGASISVPSTPAAGSVAVQVVGVAGNTTFSSNMKWAARKLL